VSLLYFIRCQFALVAVFETAISLSEDTASVEVLEVLQHILRGHPEDTVGVFVGIEVRKLVL